MRALRLRPAAAPLRRRGAARRLAALALALVAALALAPPASAHVEAEDRHFRADLGWTSEPAFAGLPNAVDVRVEKLAGGTVDAARADLSVQVTFGGEAITLPLVASGAPGRFRAAVVPTRPGTYGLHVTGTVEGRPLDVEATCSESTFDCVRPAADVQFPASAPAEADVTKRLARALARAERVQDNATSAGTRGTVGIAVAAAALVAALGGAGLGRRRRVS